MAEVLRIGRETAKGLERRTRRADPSRHQAGEFVAGGSEGRVKILDFGLARAAGKSS